MMTVSDLLATADGEFERISDEDLKKGVDRMMAIAARVCVS
jgi:hypothetical protein